MVQDDGEEGDDKPEQTRAAALARLRAMLGEEDYAAGRMPPDGARTLTGRAGGAPAIEDSYPPVDFPALRSATAGRCVGRCDSSV